MSEEEILIGNAKIAFFMNVMPVKPMQGEVDINACRWVDCNQIQKWPSWVIEPVMTNNLCYHSSWDWLMPVVEKIAMLNNHSYRICSGHTTISNNTGWVTQKVNNNPIVATYEAVIDYIDWYNTNVPENKPVN